MNDQLRALVNSGAMGFTLEGKLKHYKMLFERFILFLTF